MALNTMDIMPPIIPTIRNARPMSLVIQLTRKRKSAGGTSPKCAKFNGNEASNNAELAIQNIDANIAGGHAAFLLPAASLMIGYILKK
jgi:hypothetical protein